MEMARNGLIGRAFTGGKDTFHRQLTVERSSVEVGGYTVLILVWPCSVKLLTKACSAVTIT